MVSTEGSISLYLLSEKTLLQLYLTGGVGMSRCCILHTRLGYHPPHCKCDICKEWRAERKVQYEELAEKMNKAVREIQRGDK